MKQLLYFLTLLLSFSLTAQDDDGYVMYQSIVLKALPGHQKQLTEGLKAHNEKYHQEGAQSVNVWSINSGKRAGSLLWVKGPITWTDMDAPQSGDGHMDDWVANVAPHSKMSNMEYWRLQDDRSYMPDGMAPEVIIMRYFDIKPGKWNNAREFWSAAFELYEEQNWDVGLQIYGRQFGSDDRDWAVLWFHDNMASIDKDRDFWDNYEEKYGISRREYFERWNEMAEFQGVEIMRLRTDLSVGTGGN